MFQGIHIRTYDKRTTTGKIVFQRISDFRIELVEVIDGQAFAIRRVHHHERGDTGRLGLAHVSFLQSDEILQARFPYVGFGNLQESGIDVGTVEVNAHIVLDGSGFAFAWL